MIIVANANPDDSVTKPEESVDGVSESVTEQSDTQEVMMESSKPELSEEEKAAMEQKAEADRLEQEKAEVEQVRIKKIEDQFSVWDGSHRNLTKFIKDSMNDPKSYEHVETTYVDLGETIIVSTTFRGSNAFGGIVKNTVVAEIDLDSEILEIIDQS